MSRRVVVFDCSKYLDRTTHMVGDANIIIYLIHTYVGVGALTGAKCDLIEMHYQCALDKSCVMRLICVTCLS